MSHVEQIEDYYLRRQTYLIKLYYDTKFLHIFPRIYVFSMSVVMSNFFYNFIFNRKNVMEQDVYFAGLYLIGLVECFIIENPNIKAMYLQNEQHNFSLVEFLTEKDRCLLQKTFKITVYVAYVIWICSVAIIMVIAITPFEYPNYFFNKNWSIYLHIAFKTLIVSVAAFVYFLSSAIFAQYVHALTYNYIEMKILTYYIRNRNEHYKKILFEKNDVCYQKVMNKILLTTIQHYKKIKMNGYKTIATYGKLTFYHYFIVISTASIAIHSVLFNKQPNCGIIALTALQIFLIGSCLICCGQELSNAYENLYMELLHLDWYTFDRKNKKIYYMFLLYAQKTFTMHVLPGAEMKHPLLTQIVTKTYSFLALLQSIAQ